MNTDNPMPNKDKYEGIISSITDLRYYLGEEVFTVTESALEENTNKILKIDEVTKKMSSLNSDITALVFESKADTNLQLPDASIINKISLMSGRLANLQFGLTKIKKKRQAWEQIINDISAEGTIFAENLMDMQDYTREIIHDFRVSGYSVPKSDLANLLDPTKV